MKNIKAMATKVAIFMLRLAWCVSIFALTMGTLYVVAVALGEAMPRGTSVWFRLAIGLPCVFTIPLAVELAVIAISRRLDRHHLLGIH